MTKNIWLQKETENLFLLPADYLIVQIKMLLKGMLYMLKKFRYIILDIKYWIKNLLLKL